jgi:hypothetical protein
VQCVPIILSGGQYYGQTFGNYYVKIAKIDKKLRSLPYRARELAGGSARPTLVGIAQHVILQKARAPPQPQRRLHATQAE